MEENRQQKTYDDILNVVCEELGIKKHDMMSSVHDGNMTFARALYVQLSDDLGLNLPRAVVLLNKSRPMMRHYLDVAEASLKCDRKRYEHYENCCRALGIEKAVAEPESEEIERNEALYIRQKIGHLKPNNHYTLEEEIAIERAKAEAERYMRNYGKGLQPLMDGHAITRKKRR